MTTRALIVPFHKEPTIYQDNHKVLMDLFKLHCSKWQHYVDTLYIVDSGGHTISELPGNPEFAGRDGKVVHIVTEPRSHWDKLNQVLRGDIKEDYVGIIDSDTLIYQPQVIDRLFAAAEQHVIAGILDTSGSADLSMFEIMRENHNRAARKRICPYFMAFRRDTLRPGFDCSAKAGTPMYDSMGMVTKDWLEDGWGIYEFQDDRSSIYLEDNNQITHTQWLDSPPKLWALEENPKLGYHHTRNFSGGLTLANSYWVDKGLHEHLVKITPRREALRLLSWVWIACEKTDRDPGFMFPTILELLKAAGSDAAAVKLSPWSTYIDQVKTYYPWLESL